MSGNPIRTGQASGSDITEVVAAFRAQVAQPDMELVMFFCSADYDLELLGQAIGAAFPGIVVVGCTTAGEIGPLGYLNHSLAGVSFSPTAFTAVAGVLNDLHAFSLASGSTLVQQLLRQLEARQPQAGEGNSFALMLVDGLCNREELLSHVLQAQLGHIPLVGGSAGAGLSFHQPHVYCDGRFLTDSACLIILSTPLPFLPFRTQHFRATDERLVVTAANPERRQVLEINGLRAAEEYARLVGVEVAALDPMRFAASPVVVMIDGTEYVRSIQCANDDGSLTFFCAIEEGLVLRVAHGQDVLGNLRGAFADIRARIGAPQLVLGYDCVLRRQEIAQAGLEKAAGDILRDNNTVGFNTYGEQFRGVHVNQTLTGVAIATGAHRHD